MFPDVKLLFDEIWTIGLIVPIINSVLDFYRRLLFLDKEKRFEEKLFSLGLIVNHETRIYR